MKAEAKLALGMVILVLLLAFVAGSYYFGFQAGKASCAVAQSVSTQKAETKAKTKIRNDLARATKTGQQREQVRQSIDAHFDQLDQEATHEKPDPVDSCVLPAERLRIWNAANTGGRSDSTAPGKPDDGAAAAAPGEQRPGDGLGGEPPPSGAAVPPVGGADVRPAGVPAT